jgi:hypothetical protein
MVKQVNQHGKINKTTVSTPENIRKVKNGERLWSICKMNYKKLKKAPDTMRKFEN